MDKFLTIVYNISDEFSATAAEAYDLAHLISSVICITFNKLDSGQKCVKLMISK